MILCPGSGGWSFPVPEVDNVTGMPPIQLYDLEKDISETINLQDQYPEVVEELRSLLVKYIKEGRSTPGLPQSFIEKENWPGLEWMDK